MSIRCAARTFRPSFVCLALASVLALSGCGKSTATVSGVVKFQGEPLPSGTVLIYGADGQPIKGTISEDGKYTVADAPVGPVKIAVQVQDSSTMPGGGAGGAGGPADGGQDMSRGVPGADEHMKKGMDRAMPGNERRVVSIPARYSSPETSGLSTTLKKGKQTFPIELE
jgi:hypothetical protein